MKDPLQELTPIARLKRDVRAASITLSDDEARYLVDTYYQMQDDRIRSDARIRALKESGEPHIVLQWLAEQSRTIENQIKGCLDKYVEGHSMGDWLYSIKGVGPVLAAGLLAHIDISKVQTAGGIWRYAGQDPTCKWEKGQKRPWNAQLKVICWKLGQSFMKVSCYEDAYYGQMYRARKDYEVARNESGANAEAARIKLETVKIGKDTDAYKSYIQGKLPPAHVDARARRWVVHIFLAHLFEVWYKKHNGKPPPLPFPIAHMQHVHFILPQGVDKPEYADKPNYVPCEEPKAPKAKTATSVAGNLGAGSLGITKHRVSGHAGKSPKFKINQEIDLKKEEAEKPKRPKNKMYPSVREALDNEKI